MGVLALSFNVEWFFWQPLWLKPERCQQSIKNNAAKSRSCNHDCPCDGYLRQNVSWGTKYSSFFSKFRVFVCHLRKHPKDGDPLCKLCLRDTKTCPRIALLKIVVKKTSNYPIHTTNHRHWTKLSTLEFISWYFRVSPTIQVSTQPWSGIRYIVP